MRTNNISPEFIYNNVNGTLSMMEKKSFFGSKAIKLANNLDINSLNLIYYQNSNSEQLNLSIESGLYPIVYDIVGNKLSNLTLIMDESQSNEQKNNNTKWILKININSILNQFLFATLKKCRTFEGIQNKMTISNNVDSAVHDYITNNLISRYQFDHVDLFISYNDLTMSGLRFKNNWNSNIENNSNLVKSFSKTIKEDLEITFTQTKSSASFSFNYYFNLYYTKI